jgi:DNA-binding GntR family transcriptional regulator
MRNDQPAPTSELSFPPREPLFTKTLREQVYDHLRLAMNRGEIMAGEVLNLGEISDQLGISRTPLRDALLQLEIEGFVTILPRRGCVVRSLTEQDIRDIYQMIGALEASVIRAEAARINPGLVDEMRRLNDRMRHALDEDDFDAYYAGNLAMHDCYLRLSSNHELRRQVGIMKQRLYDFPRRRAFVKEWEVASTREHDELICLLAAGQTDAAADFVRDVHWSYEVQRPFIERYYLDAEGEFDTDGELDADRGFNDRSEFEAE